MHEIDADKFIVTPSKPPYSHVWNALVSELENPSEGSQLQGVRLRRRPPEATDLHPLVIRYLLQHKEVKRLWYGSVIGLFESGYVARSLTRRMIDCPPIGVINFSREQKKWWPCSTRFCPWCYIRRNVIIAKYLRGKVSRYTIGVLSCPLHRGARFYLDDLRDKTKKQVAVRRALSVPYIRATQFIPGAPIIARTAYLVRRGGEVDIPGVEWVRPRSVAGAIRILDPYAISYISGESRHLADALKIAKNDKCLLSSKRSLEYALQLAQV